MVDEQKTGDGSGHGTVQILISFQITPFLLIPSVRELAEEPQPVISAIQSQKSQKRWQHSEKLHFWLIYCESLPFFVLLLGKMPSGIKTNIKSASMHPYQRWVWTAASTLRWSVPSWAMKLSFTQGLRRWVQWKEHRLSATEKSQLLCEELCDLGKVTWFLWAQLLICKWSYYLPHKVVVRIKMRKWM